MSSSLSQTEELERPSPDYLVFISVLLWLASFFFFQAWHEYRFSFDKLNNFQRKQTLEVEGAVYYSLFEELVAAPSVFIALGDFLKHSQLEFPEEINLLGRFHLLPEIIIAGTYRKLAKKHQIDPLIFYTYAMFAAQSFIVVILFIVGYMLCGRVEGGLFSAIFFFGNHDLATRVTMSPPLRENLSFVFLLAQAVFLACALAEKRTVRQHAYRTTAVLFTVLHLLSWQFAPSTLLMQLFVISILHTNGTLPWSAVQQVSRIFIFSGAVSAILLLGNTVVLFSLFFFVAICLFLIQILPVKNLCCHPNGAEHSRGKLLGWICIFGSAGLIKAVISLFFGASDDLHLYSFFIAKLSGPSNYQMWEYLCSSAFQSMGVGALVYLGFSGLLPAACLGALVLGFTRISEVERSEQAIFEKLILSFALVYSVYMIVAIRFAIIAIPFLCCITAGAWNRQRLQELLAKVGWRRPHAGLVTFSAALLRNGVLVFIPALAFFRCLLSLIPASFAIDHNEQALMQWLKTQTPAESKILASASLSPRIRLLTGRSISIHPIFENTKIRKRSEKVARLYAAITEEEARDIVFSLQADYLVLETSHCFGSRELGCRIADFFHPDRDPQQSLFCEKHFDQTKYFQVIQGFPGYLVVSLRP